MMKVSAEKLCRSYMVLFPGEIASVNFEDGVRIMGNWLQRYEQTPEKAIATTNWAGKVTAALFHALGIRKPVSKKDMLKVLSGPMANPSRGGRKNPVEKWELKTYDVWGNANDGYVNFMTGRAMSKTSTVKNNPAGKPCFGPGQCEYKTVDISTESGLKEAERIWNTGKWYIASQSPWRIQFYRKKGKAMSNPAYSHRDNWIIEKRTASGNLSFTDPQPEKFFGKKAITGITSDEMAKVIFRHVPNAELHGTNIPAWPSLLDKQFVARVKYW